MKKLIIFLLVLASLSCQTQTFDPKQLIGTKWQCIETFSNPTSTYGWLKNYIVPGDGGNFSVRSTIYDELNKHADTWFNDPSTPASYYNSKKVDGEFPNWKSDYDYKWSTLFNALGINVK